MSMFRKVLAAFTAMVTLVVTALPAAAFFPFGLGFGCGFPFGFGFGCGFPFGGFPFGFGCGFPFGFGFGCPFGPFW